MKNPEDLYAKVNKTLRNTPKTQSKAPIALGKFLHDSLKNLSIKDRINALPPLPEPPHSVEDTSYYGYSDVQIPLRNEKPDVEMITCTSSMSHCQSLNNIGEQHSPPKTNRNLSKSDLSLHRSEIFLDNLCRSEIVIEKNNSNSLHQTSINVYFIKVKYLIFYYRNILISESK